MATFADSGRFTEQMLRGNLYVYHVPAQALLLSATTGGHPTLINPTGSGRVFVPVQLRLSFVSGTTVIGSVLLAETLNVGGGAATGAPVLTATLVSAKGGRRGLIGNSNMQWSPTTNTFTAAPTVIAATGINLGPAAPGASQADLSEEFNGTLGFEPGTALSLVYSVTSAVALFQVTLWGLELPYPSL